MALSPFCFLEELAMCQRCSRRIAEQDGDDEGRNGFVISVLNPMFGRGGVADDAATTYRQGCGESTSKPFQRKLAMSPRAVRRGVEKKRSPKVGRDQRASRAG